MRAKKRMVLLSVLLLLIFSLQSVFVDGKRLVEAAEPAESLKSAESDGEETLPEQTVLDEDPGAIERKARAYATSGNCGDQGSNITWSYDNDGTLTISGTGKMDDFLLLSYYIPQPWEDLLMYEEVTDVVIQEGVTSIGWNAFFGFSDLQSVTIPNSVTVINPQAFLYCRSLPSISIPDSVTEIGYSAFQGCGSLQSVRLSENLEGVWGRVFKGCTSLQTIHIPDSVTEILNSAFEGCTSLQSVTIPDGVRSIDSKAFNGCPALKSVFISANVKTIGSNAFGYLNENEKNPDFTIIGYSGTAAEKYAKENLFRFVAQQGPVDPAIGVQITGSILTWDDKEDLSVFLYSAYLSDDDIRQDMMQDAPQNVLATGTVDSAITAEDGKHYSQSFTLNGIAEGEYKLAVYKPGRYVPLVIPVTVEEKAVSLGEQKLWLLGDVNNDGRLNSTDAQQIQRYVVEASSVFDNGTEADKANRFLAANVNWTTGNTRIDSTDAQQIQRYLVGAASVLDGVK